MLIPVLPERDQLQRVGFQNGVLGDAFRDQAHTILPSVSASSAEPTLSKNRAEAARNATYCYHAAPLSYVAPVSSEERPRLN